MDIKIFEYYYGGLIKIDAFEEEIRKFMDYKVSELIDLKQTQSGESGYTLLIITLIYKPK